MDACQSCCEAYPGVGLSDTWVTKSMPDPKDFENAFKDAEDVYLNSGHKLLDDYAMVHRQSNEINDEIIFPIGFADGANYNTNIWNQWYMMPYAIGGWLGLGKRQLLW